MPQRKAHGCALRATPFPASSSGGFTLLDMLLVVVILGIVGLGTFPQMRGLLAERRMQAVTTELVSALQYAAALAVRHQRPFGVALDSSANTIQVYDQRYRGDASGHPDAAPPVTSRGVVVNPLSKAWYITDLDDGLPPGELKTFAFYINPLVFYPDGHSSSFDAWFVLSSRTVGYLLVRVNGTTGRITVMK